MQIRILFRDQVHLVKIQERLSVDLQATLLSIQVDKQPGGDEEGVAIIEFTTEFDEMTLRALLVQTGERFDLFLEDDEVTKSTPH